MTTALWLAIAAGIIAVIFGLVSRSWILARDPGNPRMQEISHAIQQGATAYLTKQYTTIAIVAWFFSLSSPSFPHWALRRRRLCRRRHPFRRLRLHRNERFRQGQRSHRSGSQPRHAEALNVAFKGGAITGMLVVGLGLLGVAGYMAVLIGTAAPDANLYTTIKPLIGLAFGSSLISIFARLGGGIFTKAPTSVRPCG